MKTRPVFLDKPGIAEFVALSVDTLERMVQQGKFPPSRQTTISSYEKQCGL